jgi:zinc protease
MYQFFPDANLGRRWQAFEIWIRPVQPHQAVFALKAALYELRALIANGLDEEAFESTREYLSKNVFVMTKSQDAQLGYALDSRWYGTGDFVESMRVALARLTLDDVNGAIRRHLSGDRLHVVMVAKDGAGLRGELLAEGPTAIVYDAPKPEAILAEDRLIGAVEIGLRPEDITMTPVAQVFA